MYLAFANGTLRSTYNCFRQEITMEAIAVIVNGKQQRITAPPDEPLLWVLRDQLQLTGTKYGCGEGQCGACTILLDGKPVRSCLTQVAAAAGKHVITVEGLEQNGTLHPVQQAFLREEAFQCGYCTSGMILSAVALLGSNRTPTEEEIVHAMSGNICRCGTYPRIVAAVREAAQATKG
jgi:aerobic-type carbon monoxide dehydrogenase small subunit (CoxS/CutS family)